MNNQRLLQATFAVLAFILIGGCAPTPKAETAKAPIEARQFWDAPVIGILDQPLGNRTVIEGTRREYGLGIVLVVAKVNDIALVKPQTINLTSDNNVEQHFQRGAHYKLEGYEAGDFGGYPDWTHAGAQMLFGYHPKFVVTRVIEPSN